MRAKSMAAAMLDEMGLLQYGAHIPANIFRQAFDIEEIEEPATREEFRRQELQELAASDWLRNRLLNDGKYLKGTDDGYRILLPSENATQVLSYFYSSKRKMDRGFKLLRNSPPEVKISGDEEVRAVMRRESLKEHLSALHR